MKEESTSVPADILASIKSRNITPKSKGYFVCLTALGIVGLLAVIIGILYIASLALFSLHQSGAWLLPSFGLNGLGIFIASLPWLLIAVVLVLLLLLGRMVRCYSFGYHQPILYSGIALLILAVGGSCLVNESAFHSKLMKKSNIQGMSGMVAMYHYYADERVDRIIPCTIVERTTTGYTARNEEDQLIKVVIDQENPNLSSYQPGDLIAILGDCAGMTIHADAIKRIQHLPILSPAIQKRRPPCDF